MLDDSPTTRRTVEVALKFLPLVVFVVPVVMLYFIPNPFNIVFENTWKGRIFYVFFLWLISLEIILAWEGLRAEKIKNESSARTGTFILALSMPTVYVVVSNFFGLNNLIYKWAIQTGMATVLAGTMPLSTEYLVFALLFGLIIVLEYGFRGLKIHSASLLFLTAIGVIYMIDNVYSQNFIPFQVLVPTTSSLALSFLNFLGHPTVWAGASNYVPTLTTHGQIYFSATIAWPCSGIESLVIYTVTILMFLNLSAVPLKRGIVYFLFGAIFTYFINILRIVNIFIIGANGGNIWPFHDSYGQLYSISWIAFYPLLIMASRAFLERSAEPAIAESSVPAS